MDYVSIAQVPHRRSVDARMPNGQPLGHPMFSRPTSPPSLTNRRSTPIMRPSNGSFSASQYAKSNPKGRDAPITPAIYSSGSPNDMRITSSSYGSTSFQTYHPHLPTQRPADPHTGSAPSSLPIDVSHPSSHRMPAASGYSERRINDLGNNNSDGDSDDSSCVLFETTINGDYCIRSDAFPDMVTCPIPAPHRRPRSHSIPRRAHQAQRIKRTTTSATPIFSTLSFPHRAALRPHPPLLPAVHRTYAL